uniref:Tail assembly chaperone n=2 Tax=unclassified bacterial viruses TaxID=12333 RepID=A0AAU7J7L1_9VIRU
MSRWMPNPWWGLPQPILDIIEDRHLFDDEESCDG